MGARTGLNVGMVIAAGMLAAAYLVVADDQPPPGEREELQARVTANPDDAGARARLALALQAQGQSALALEHAKAAWDLNPNDARTLLAVAQVYTANERWDAGQAALERALQVPADIRVIRVAARQLARITAKQGRLDAFLAQADAELAQQPGDLVARWKVIEGYAASSKPQEAIAKMTSLLAQTPRDEHLRARLAQAYARNGQLAEGLKVLQEGMKAKPDSHVLAEAVAEAYVQANQPDKAVMRYETLLAKSTDEWRRAFYRSRIDRIQQLTTGAAPTNTSP